MNSRIEVVVFQSHFISRCEGDTVQSLWNFQVKPVIGKRSNPNLINNT